MDTEAIASEIVHLKTRIAELDAEEASGADVKAERDKLHERMRALQDSLSKPDPRNEVKRETEADKIQFINPE